MKYQSHRRQSWKDMSPEDRDRIERNRSLVSVISPFNGKNSAQRQALQGAFLAMTHKFASSYR